MVFLLTFCSVG